MQSLNVQKQELDKLIDQQLSNEFDGIILNDFCAKAESSAKYLLTSLKYFFGQPAFVSRSLEILVHQKISFSKTVSGEGCAHPVKILIEGNSSQSKLQFSLTDLCSIFLPEHKFEITKDWQKTLRENLQVLNSDLKGLCERKIAVSIGGGEIKAPGLDFWGQIEMTPTHRFYAQAYPILKHIVSKGVPEISIAARWGSDSPYQRFLKSDHWSLFSFRISKRQQVDLAQYTELKKIKLRCALLDLGFLENGYGKVAKIKELISIEIPSDSSTDKISTIQLDFFAKVLKQMSELVK
ncbi:MAG TPA: hypothetical protein VIG33_05085 [Pseudobdellovibrionaceae bacterium]|jgi:hypothetical protein